MKAPMFSVEVTTVPVSDVDRALRFYKDQVGFVLGIDYSPNSAFRVVQFTPPSSRCSIQIGNGLTDAPVGSLRNFSSSQTLRPRGAACSNVGWRLMRYGTRRPSVRETEVSRLGSTPRGDYASFTNFSDPDGNSWVLQERGYRNG